MGFPSGSDGKEFSCNTGDLGLLPGLRRSPGGGRGNPLQVLTWRIPMDRRAWWATVHGVVKGWIQLSDKAQFKGILFCVTFQGFYKMSISPAFCGH